MVQMKNRVSGLLMETGVSYNKQRLHKVGYFAELMTGNEDVHESIRPLLKLSRDMISRAQKLDYALVSSLERDPLLKERLRRLRTVPGVGPITALTWALEIGDFTRFSSIKQALSYCGLCGDEKSSADKVMRMPISKFTLSESLRKHVLAVEACVRAYARKFGEDEELWGLIGLIHDFDYEKYPSAEDHPFRGSEILKERGYSEDV